MCKMLSVDWDRDFPSVGVGKGPCVCGVANGHTTLCSLKPEHLSETSSSNNKASLTHLPRSTSVILKLKCASQSPGGLVKRQIAGFLPKFLIQQVWYGAKEFVFPACFQEMLMLLVQDHTWRTTDLHCILGLYNFLKSKNGTEAKDPKTIISLIWDLLSFRPTGRIVPDPAQGLDIPGCGHSQVRVRSTGLSLPPPSQVFRESRMKLSKVALPHHPQNTFPNWLNELWYPYNPMSL